MQPKVTSDLPGGELSGRIALVTGGARNVGRAITLALADAGATVLINHFRSPPSQVWELVAEVESRGGRADLFRASVARSAQVEQMFADIGSRHGRLDILVNNAADGRFIGVDDVSAEDLDLAWDTNLKGALRCSLLARPLLRAAGGGSIVNISTLGGGELVLHSYLANGPTKAAVESLTRYLAADLAADGIRVNTAVASVLASEVADSFPDAAALQQAVVAATPLGRLGHPEEFAQVVTFLASPRSSFVTGQTIIADGGLATGRALLAPPSETSRVPAPEPASAPERKNPTERDNPEERDNPTEPIGAAPPSVVDDEIVIVGIGTAVPGARNPEGYWQELLHGGDNFVEVPTARWNNEWFHSDDRSAVDRTYSRRSAFITDPEAFAEPGADSAEYTTTWLRHSLQQALSGVGRRDEDNCAFLVGYTADGSHHLEDASVALGVLARSDADPADPDEVSRHAILQRALRRHYPRSGPDPWQYLPHVVGRQAMAGILPDSTDVKMVDTACSSSLYAIDLGMKGLLEGRYDIAACGGAFALGPRGSILFAKLGGLSPTGEVRAFDASSDGVLFADGAAMVILKRLSRARADGDQILATVRSCGSSSDGRGKAIYAPNAAGQATAIRRSRRTESSPAPDLVIAHATGTRAGDLAEVTALRETLAAPTDPAGTSNPLYVTSNKSVVGHLGWAAGAVSVIEAVLALQHDTIPPQHRYVHTDPDLQLEQTPITIPTTPAPWRRRLRGRREAAVSGFGFGGTNAQLVVADPPPPGAAIRQAPAGGDSEADRSVPRIAVVGFSSHLPEGGPTFGDEYPAPSVSEVMLPPAMVRGTDRTQLMALHCAQRLRTALGDFWDAQRDTTGVILGHMGPTRNAMLYATRCHLSSVREMAASDTELRQHEWAGPRIERVAAELTRLVPDSSEHTFPGLMPNVIAARVANYCDLHGLNLVVDTGFTSTESAIDLACRYLTTGELTMALAGGVNGNSTPEMARLVASQFPAGPEPSLHEGCLMFALVTEEVAHRNGLEILGLIDPVAANITAPDGEVTSYSSAPDRRWLGAASAVTLARAVSPPISPRNEAAVVDSTDQPRSQDVALSDNESGVSQVTAYHLEEVAEAGSPGPAPIMGWPSRQRGLVITDSPAVGQAAHVHGVPVLLIRPGVEQDLQAELRAAVAAQDPSHPAHVRVLLELTAERALGEVGTDAVHEAAFLAAKHLANRLVLPGAEFVVGINGAVAGDGALPITGLFSGLVKVINLEFADALTFQVNHDGSGIERLAELIQSESMLGRALPVVTYRGGVRHVHRLVSQPVRADRAADPVSTAMHRTDGLIHRESVVVALGGGRGITAEILLDIASREAPRIVVIGSNPLHAHPDLLMRLSADEFASARASFIREAVARGESVKHADTRFNRIRDARVTQRTLQRLRAHCGHDRVLHLVADVTDPRAITSAITELTRWAGGDAIDLFLNAAGQNGPRPIRTKSVAEFHRIRDVRLLGYRNLLTAFGTRRPRLWLNFGSLLGVTGQVGEADYASVNDFLGLAAQYRGAAEYTIGWTLWGQAGMGAGDLTGAYFARTGMYSAITTAEGIGLFRQELASAVQPDAPRLSIHLGSRERQAVTRLVPGLLDPPSPPDVHRPTPTVHRPTSPRHAPMPLQDSVFHQFRVLSRDRSQLVLERVFDVGRDSYLAHHLVRDRPTFPGMFVAELACAAAEAHLPGRRACSVLDLEFRSYLKVAPGHPVTRRVTVTRVGGNGQTAGTVEVVVTVSGDVVAPSGVTLVRDRVNFAARVLLADDLPTAPDWAPWPALDETPVPDPYHVSSAPVRLTGPFRSTTRTRLHPWGKRATADLRAAAADTSLQGMVRPAVLLDGLARTGVLAVDEDGRTPLAAPVGVGRIDFFESGGDAQLAARHPNIDLYAVVEDDLHAPRSHFAAVAGTGRVITRLRDLRWLVLGQLDAASGSFVQPRSTITSPAGTPRHTGASAGAS